MIIRINLIDGLQGRLCWTCRTWNSLFLVFREQSDELKRPCRRLFSIVGSYNCSTYFRLCREKFSAVQWKKVFLCRGKIGFKFCLLLWCQSRVCRNINTRPRHFVPPLKISARWAQRWACSIYAEPQPDLSKLRGGIIKACPVSKKSNEFTSNLQTNGLTLKHYDYEEKN